MALKTYAIEKFVGINQSSDMNFIPQVFSPDAANMDTDNGDLRVASGYMKFIPIAIPGSSNIDALTVYKSSGADQSVIITGGKIYAFKSGEWVLIHTYTSTRANPAYDSAMVRINTTDYLVIADGMHQLIKYDGTKVTEFGSEEGCSNIPVSYLTMYRGRLFAAGDEKNPDRLYYSVLPGSGRTVEDWGYVEASPAVEGGHAEIGSTGGDPIVAIHALSNQLLIFKKNSLYRLIGDRPSNFTIERIDANFRSTLHTAITAYRDVLYFVTQDGLYYYNGITARPCPDMKMIRDIMIYANINSTRAVVACDKLYFSIKHMGDDKLIVYDLIEHKYMVRDGFKISDLTILAGSLLIVNDKRYVYIFNRGDSYDGEPINAYWKTPLTDLGDKASVKSLHEMYLRGTGDVLIIKTKVGAVENTYRKLLPKTADDVLEIPLLNEGRCIQFTFCNEGGGAFKLEGGIEVCLGLRRRTE